ncbi:FkbM family methyltransferase [Chamaesiphon sp. VAR_48_metabat_135_sub]|uniref:FkbM family methyltransferase n=1 Tax=Chamaesiphon sp. VAR_48_metabat_135_sub TaxID=2964699 RepID=UPI00286B92DA|nr:FkbM family methyltransferase [Chamaesiphon sp. VAR_48_metabat_135_sub]
MSHIAGLLKTEYLYQPKYLLARIKQELHFGNSDRSSGASDFDLPWGLTITADRQEEHGKILATLGIIDLSVTEAIWRLLKPGNTFLDVGANIGYMTSVAIARLESFNGLSGRVIAFEPHPDIYRDLTANVDRWRSQPVKTEVTLERLALSNETGFATLEIPREFKSNRGLSHVVSASSNLNDLNIKYPSKQSAQKIPIQCRRLDDYWSADNSIDLMKVDVEGHELAVFEGASRCLSLRQIRHILFEDHEHYPNQVTNFLESKGYTILAIDRKLFSPKIVEPYHLNLVSWLPNSYLATCKPQDVFKSFERSRYQIFDR